MRLHRLVLAVVTVSALSACTVAAPMSGGSMMGAVAVPPAGVMGVVPGYTFANAACSAPTELAGATVNVMLGDMNMHQMMSGTASLGEHMMLRAAPSTVAAGDMSFVVWNMGWRTHELVVLPLADGQQVGHRAVGADGKVDEAGSLGEVSNSCAAGAGEGITSGSVGWETMALPAGHYELVCNLPNHYADGMRQELIVT